MSAHRSPAAARAPGESEFCLVLDEGFRIVGCDRMFASWLGHDSAEGLRDRPLADLLDHGSRAKLDAVRASLDRPDPVTTELVHLRADGHRAVARYRMLPPGLLGPEQRRTIALGSDAEPVLMLIEEVIELKREREAELARMGSAKERLERTQADLQAISHTIHHDVSNALNAIQLKAYLLPRLPPAKMGETIREVQDFCRHIARVMSGFVALADVETTPPRPARVDPGLAFRSVLSRAKMQWPDIASRCEARCEGPAPWADPRHVEQVFEKVVANAFQYRDPARSELVIGLDSAAGPGPDMVTLTVADNGPGIPEDRHDAILNLLARVPKGGVGRGIGLVIAKRLAEANGGTLGLESRPGAGTTVRLTLPVATA